MTHRLISLKLLTRGIMFILVDGSQNSTIPHDSGLLGEWEGKRPWVSELVILKNYLDVTMWISCTNSAWAGFVWCYGEC